MGGLLLYEPAKNIVDDVLKISEKPINCVFGWWFVESAVVPDGAVLEFSCSVVDTLAVAVQKATEEVWWLVNSCPLPLTGPTYRTPAETQIQDV